MQKSPRFRLSQVPKGLSVDDDKTKAKATAPNQQPHQQPAVMDDNSDDDFQNVDEYEEGDANPHKNHDAILLQNHPTGLRQQQVQKQTKKITAAKVTSLTALLQQKNNKPQKDVVGNLLQNYQQNSKPPRLNTGSKPNGQSNSTIVSNFNLNQSDIQQHSKDNLPASSRMYVPRQKSKNRLAKTQIGMSITTTIMNLSRNDDTNMSRVNVNNIVTEFDGYTKPDDHSNINLTTQQYDNATENQQQQFGFDMRRKSNPSTKRTVQQLYHHQQLQSSKVHSKNNNPAVLEQVPSLKNQRGNSQQADAIQTKSRSAVQQQQQSVKYLPPTRQNNNANKSRHLQQMSMTQNVNVSHNASSRSLDFGRAYEKLVGELANKTGGAHLLVPEHDMIIKETQEIVGKPVFDIESRSKSIADMQRKKKEKLEKAQQEKLDEEMKECTFQPQLLSFDRRKASHQAPMRNNPSQNDLDVKYNHNNNTSRGIDEFIQDQQKFLEIKMHKQEIQRKQETEEIKKNLMSKKINKKSIDLLKKRQERIRSLNKNGEEASQQANSLELNMQDTHQSGTVQDKPTVHTVNISIARKDGGKPGAGKSKQNTANPSSKTSSRKQQSQSKTIRSQSQNEIVIHDQQQQPQLKNGRSPKNNDIKKILQEVNINNKKFDQLIPKNSHKKMLSQATSLEMLQHTQNQQRLGSADHIHAKSTHIDKYLLNKFNKKFDKARETLQMQQATPEKSKNQKMHARSPGREHHKKSGSRERMPIRAINDSSPSNLFANKAMRDNVFYTKGSSMQQFQVREMLIQLGLIMERSNAKPNEEEELLFADFWRLLRPIYSRLSEVQGEIIYMENLRLVLQVILKLIDPKRVCDPEEISIVEWKAAPFNQNNNGATDEQKPGTGANRQLIEQGQIGYVDKDGLLYIRPKEVPYLQQRFEQFRYNSISYNKDQSTLKKQLISGKSDTTLFNPQISKKSIMMGQERKRKIAREIGIEEQQLDKMTDPKNLLPLIKNFELNKREQQAKKYDEDFKKKYTFAPDTKLTKGKVKPRQYQPNQSASDRVVTTIQSIDQLGISAKKPSEQETKQNQHNSRFMELYGLRKRQIDQRDKSREDYEFEKEQNECTFKPTLTENLRNQSRNNRKAQQLSSNNQQQSSQSGDNAKGNKLPPTVNIFFQKKTTMNTSASNRSKLSEQRSLERIQRGRQEKIKKDSITRIGERLSQKQPNHNNNNQQNEQQQLPRQSSTININVRQSSAQNEVDNNNNVPQSITIITGQQNNYAGEAPVPLNTQYTHDNSTLVAQSFVQNSSQINSPTISNYVQQMGGINQNQSASPNNGENSDPSTQRHMRMNITRSSHISEPPIASSISPIVEGARVGHADDTKVMNQQQNISHQEAVDLLFIQDQQEHKEITETISREETSPEKEKQASQKPPKPERSNEKAYQNTDKIEMPPEHMRKSSVKEFIPESKQLKVENKDTTQSQQVRATKVGNSKVTEYKNNTNNAKDKNQIGIDADDDGLDNIDSDDEGHGVPLTNQSDIREAIESNMSKANQFSTHKSMSIRETEPNDHSSHKKSQKKIMETSIEGNSPNTQKNNTVSQEVNKNITESPYHDPGSGNDSFIHVKEEVVESPSNRLSHARSTSNASSIAPLLFVDVNLGPEHQERIVIYDGDTPVILAQTFCKQHDLDDEMEEQLTLLLQQQMASILPKVVEEEDYDQENTEENDYEQRQHNKNHNQSIEINSGPDTIQIKDVLSRDSGHDE